MSAVAQETPAATLTRASLGLDQNRVGIVGEERSPDTEQLKQPEPERLDRKVEGK